MKEIKLTQGYTTLVDDGDYSYLTQWDWSIMKIGNTHYYAKRSIKLPNKKRQLILMHRVIMSVVDDVFIDHVDGNGLNNQRANLRLCNHSQNMCNRKSHGISKYLGVDFHGNRWRASIRHNKQRTHIGYYKTEIDAAIAYNEMAIKYHGEFAKLNIID